MIGKLMAWNRMKKSHLNDLQINVTCANLSRVADEVMGQVPGFVQTT
jgi:hypothetical protein